MALVFLALQVLRNTRRLQSNRRRKVCSLQLSVLPRRTSEALELIASLRGVPRTVSGTEQAASRNSKIF